MFGPALIAVADLRLDVIVTQPVERLRRALAELLDDLDRVDFRHQPAEHCGLVSAAGADLQDLVGGLRLELLGHVGHDERRRDGLALADRHADIEIGVSPQRGGNELVPRGGAHRVADPSVLHARGNHFVLDQSPPRFGPRIGGFAGGRRIGVALGRLRRLPAMRRRGSAIRRPGWRQRQPASHAAEMRSQVDAPASEFNATFCAMQIASRARSIATFALSRSRSALHWRSLRLMELEPDGDAAGVVGQLVPGVAAAEVEVAAGRRLQRALAADVELGAELVVFHQDAHQPAATMVIAIGIDGLESRCAIRQLPVATHSYCMPGLTVRPVGCHPRPARWWPSACCPGRRQANFLFQSQAHRSTR